MNIEQREAVNMNEEPLNDAALWQIERDIIGLVKMRTFRNKDRLNRNNQLRAAVNRLNVFFVGFNLDYLHNVFKLHDSELSLNDLKVLLYNIQGNNNIERATIGFSVNKEADIKILYSKDMRYKTTKEMI